MLDPLPIAVWLQSPGNAAAYRELGITLYVGLWQGPTDAQLDALKRAGMPVVCAQNAVGLARRNDPIIAGWMHGDEPDNAQPVVDPATGKTTGYGPFVPPEKIVDDYRRLKDADPGRPVLLNLGQGVANDDWVGRGPGATLSDYETYVHGADVVSFDVYPVAGVGRPDRLWMVAQGVERLVRWAGSRRPVWSCIECTGIESGRRPTPAQVRSEVWMALIHGARGLIWFVHAFAPRFDESALLSDPEMRAAVRAINARVRELTPVLEAPAVDALVSVRGSEPGVPIALTARRHGGALFVLAVGMRHGRTRATFRVRGLPRRAVAQVLDEDRAVPVEDGVLVDDFGPFDARLYRIVPA